MNSSFHFQLDKTLSSLKSDGLYKSERVITTPQSHQIEVNGGPSVVNLCANNYLGLSSHPEIKAAAIEAIERWGYGLS
ncbi:MAG: glycine C-acetyltransferase, partial [Verrucomicrobiales bacterium]